MDDRGHADMILSDGDDDDGGGTIECPPYYHRHDGEWCPRVGHPSDNLKRRRAAKDVNR